MSIPSTLMTMMVCGDDAGNYDGVHLGNYGDDDGGGDANDGGLHLDHLGNDDDGGGNDDGGDVAVHLDHLVLLQGWSCSNLSGLQCSCCCYVATPAKDGLCLCKERPFHEFCRCQLSFYLYFHALLQCYSSFPIKLKRRHHLADVFDKGGPRPSSLRRLPAARRLRRFQQVLLPPPQDVQPQLGKLGLRR